MGPSVHKVTNLGAASLAPYWFYARHQVLKAETLNLGYPSSLKRSPCQPGHAAWIRRQRRFPKAQIDDFTQGFVHRIQDLSMYRCRKDKPRFGVDALRRDVCLEPVGAANLRSPPLRSGHASCCGSRYQVHVDGHVRHQATCQAGKARSSCALTAWLKVSSTLPSPVLDRISRNHSSLGE